MLRTPRALPGFAEQPPSVFEGWQVGLNLTPDEGADCVKYGEMVKAATREQYPSVHPENPEFTGPTIAMITGNPVSKRAHGRNTVVISTGDFDWENPSTWTGALDRSACGTGTSARLACLHADGLLAEGQTWRQESILGSVFEGAVRVIDGQVVPRIRGTAYVTADATLLLDPDDPFRTGIHS